MNKLIFILAIIPVEMLIAQSYDVQRLRDHYYKASQKSADADAFYHRTRHTDESSPLLLGYKAMAEFMKCYHSWNPVNKLSYFDKAKKHMDKAIELEPSNIELRYLRFTVQTSAPAFLGYSQNIEQDKLILKSTSKKYIDAGLLGMIKVYMASCDVCTAEEKQYFKNL